MRAMLVPTPIVTVLVEVFMTLLGLVVAETPNVLVQGRRAKRGNREAQLLGGPLERRVRRHRHHLNPNLTASSAEM